MTASAAFELIGRSAATLRTRELVRRAGTIESCVLLVAEPGVDAEGVARELHSRARARTAPFVTLDGAGAESTHLERALFGAPPPHSAADLESVSADSRLAAARGGTLYVQGLGDLPAVVQTRLARLVRDNQMRLSGEPASLDTRIIASATPSIDDDVHEQRFRPELYRRLAVTRIDLPPLRDRADDVPALAERVLADVCASMGAPSRSFTHAALALLAALNWPGNLGELRNVIGRIVAEWPEAVIQIEQVVPALQLKRLAVPFVPAGKLRDARLRFERDYIAAVLQHHGWRVSEAAQTLGIQRPNLYRKARQLGIPIARLTD